MGISMVNPFQLEAMGKRVRRVWLQTSNWKGLTIDIPMDQKAYSPRHLPCDRRHLTVSLLIRWGCVLLVPDCIKGHEPLFLRHACGRLLTKFLRCIITRTPTFTSVPALPLH